MLEGPPDFLENPNESPETSTNESKISVAQEDPGGQLKKFSLESSSPRILESVGILSRELTYPTKREKENHLQK